MSKEQERAELHRTIWQIANDLRGSVDDRRGNLSEIPTGSKRRWQKCRTGNSFL